LTSQVDVTSYTFTTANYPSPYFIGNVGTVDLGVTTSSAGNPFYGTVAVQSLQPATPLFTSLTAAAPNCTVAMVSGGTCSVQLTYFGNGTDADAGNGKPIGSFAIAVTGSPSLQMPGSNTATFSNALSINTTPPFTAVVGSTSGPVFTG